MSTVTDKLAALRDAYVALGQDVGHLSDDELLGLALGKGARTVPAWARKDAAGRIAELREAYARDGEDVSGLSDAELLNREVEHGYAESRRHHNAYSLLLQDQVKHDRAVYTAASRQAREAVDARGGLYLAAILRRSALPVTGLVHRISQLPERPGPKAVAELQQAARTVQWQLDGVVTDQVIGEVAERDEGVKLVDAQAAEIRRLRDVVTAQARRLHAEHGGKGTRETEWRCECPGCELIRSMDDDREPVLHTVTETRSVPAEG